MKHKFKTNYGFHEHENHLPKEKKFLNRIILGRYHFILVNKDYVLMAVITGVLKL